MINFIIIFNSILSTLSSQHFFLFAEIIACTVGFCIGFSLFKNYIKQNVLEKQHNYTFYFLMLVVISTVIENLSWIFKLSNEFHYISIPTHYIIIFNITAWVFTFVRYQALGLFVENLIANSFTFRWYQKIFLIINAFCAPLLIYSVAYFISQKPSFISLTTILRVLPFYFIASIIPSIAISFVQLRRKNIPAILKKQVSIFLKFIIFPHLLFDILQFTPFFGPQGAGANTAGIIGTLSLIFMTIAIIFCAFNLIRFRLFNFSNKVQDRSNTSLTGGFKNIIESVSFASSPQELTLITQAFFKENFKIAPENVCLNFRYKQEMCSANTDSYCNLTSNLIESFINKKDKSVELLQEYRILVADEITFDAYYNSDRDQIALVQFLQSINSEIFLPMYDKNNIIAYLTIKRSNLHLFYSHADQNKIVIFGTYLASAINIMHNSNTITLVQENKKVKEELYFKHQEINQYKESIKVLLKQKLHSQVGILLYKDHKFTFANETAQNLLPINLNQQRKHPATITITKLAEQVETFRTTQSRFLYDNNNKQLMVTGVPHLDYQGGVILTIHYPDTSDVIKNLIEKLQDPSQIDYVLYLQTTKSGKLINQIIPSNSESLLHFKIQLLEIALSKKATLLQSHSDDLLAIVEIIHHISLRNTLHILDLKPTATTHDLAIKLFGLNPLLLQEQEEGLLKKLNLGTLFIKNIELLDLDTQNKLAEFIRYGIFTIYKSEHKISSDVRIICSVSQNPQILIEQNKLSIHLYKQIEQTNIHMPSLLTMETQELHDLIDGFAYQTVQASSFANLLQLSKKDKDEIIQQRPASLQDFKIKIQQILAQKSKEYHIFQETHCDPEFNVTNPKLLKAANLGKHALKDAEIMSMLWQQFQCQNKIAQFIGVNRSSVQRRCKEYNLL